MKGSRFHNESLAQPIAEAGAALGACVRTEYAISKGQRARAVDVYLEWEGYRVVAEVGCSIARVHRETRKAQDLHADLLLLVFPTPQLAAAARRKLRRSPRHLRTPRTLIIRALPLGLALGLLRNPLKLRHLLARGEAPVTPAAQVEPLPNHNP